MELHYKVDGCIIYTIVDIFTLSIPPYLSTQPVRLEIIQSRTDCTFSDRIVGYELPKCQTFSQLRFLKKKVVCECGNSSCVHRLVHQIHIVSQYIDMR